MSEKRELCRIEVRILANYEDVTLVTLGDEAMATTQKHEEKLGPSDSRGLGPDDHLVDKVLVDYWQGGKSHLNMTLQTLKALGITTVGELRKELRSRSKKAFARVKLGTPFGIGPRRRQCIIEALEVYDQVWDLQ